MKPKSNLKGLRPMKSKKGGEKMNSPLFIAIKYLGGQFPLLWYSKPTKEEVASFEDDNWIFYKQIN